LLKRAIQTQRKLAFRHGAIQSSVSRAVRAACRPADPAAPGLASRSRHVRKTIAAPATFTAAIARKIACGRPASQNPSTAAAICAVSCNCPRIPLARPGRFAGT